MSKTDEEQPERLAPVPIPKISIPRKHAPRVPLACEMCRARKRRCDGKDPCKPCVGDFLKCKYDCTRPKQRTPYRSRERWMQVQEAQRRLLLTRIQQLCALVFAASRDTSIWQVREWVISLGLTALEGGLEGSVGENPMSSAPFLLEPGTQGSACGSLEASRSGRCTTAQLGLDNARAMAESSCSPNYSSVSFSPTVDARRGTETEIREHYARSNADLGHMQQSPIQEGDISTGYPVHAYNRGIAQPYLLASGSLAVETWPATSSKWQMRSLDAAWFYPGCRHLEDAVQVKIGAAQSVSVPVLPLQEQPLCYSLGQSSMRNPCAHDTAGQTRAFV